MADDVICYYYLIWLIYTTDFLWVAAMSEALFDTQIDSIQSLNFAQNWFNSIFNSKSFKENSIQKIIQIQINHCDSIQYIIQLTIIVCDSIQYIIQLTIIVCDSIQKIIQIRRKGSIEIVWIWWGHHHCSPVGPIWRLWSPLGLFTVFGPHFLSYPQFLYFTLFCK